MIIIWMLSIAFMHCDIQANDQLVLMLSPVDGVQTEPGFVNLRFHREPPLEPEKPINYSYTPF